MSATACAARRSFLDVDKEDIVVERSVSASSVGEGRRWMTKQVIAACLWSAFFGLLCGYGWMFLHMSHEPAAPANTYQAVIASLVDKR